MSTSTILGVVLILAVVAVLVVVKSMGQGAEEQASQEQPDEAGKAALERARKDVEQFGWHLVGVENDERSGFLYTIGLWETHRHPEIVLFAPDANPMGMAKLLQTIVRRVSAGESFAAGNTYEGLFGKHDGAFREVHTQWYPTYLGTAGGFYESFDFPALQLFWPDKQGQFPWDSGCSPASLEHQPVLYESNLLLANVGYEAIQYSMSFEGSESLESSLAELLVDLDPEQGNELMESWRWLVGAESAFFHLTLFGDLFYTDGAGSIHWLVTDMGQTMEMGANEEEWLQTIAESVALTFRASTLLQLRNEGLAPGPGEVFSGASFPMESAVASTIGFADATVYVSTLGRQAQEREGEAAAEEAVAAEEEPLFHVVRDSKGQYSMWSIDRPTPEGWEKVGKTGTKDECLTYIEEVWVDP